MLKFNHYLHINEIISWQILFKRLLLTLNEKCPNTEFFLVRIQTEYGKIRTRKNSVFGNFSRRVIYAKDYSNEHDWTPVNQIEYVTYTLGKLGSSEVKLTYTHFSQYDFIIQYRISLQKKWHWFIYLFIIYLFKSLFTVSINDSQS